MIYKLLLQYPRDRVHSQNALWNGYKQWTALQLEQMIVQLHNHTFRYDICNIWLRAIWSHRSMTIVRLFSTNSYDALSIFLDNFYFVMRNWTRRSFLKR